MRSSGADVVPALRQLKKKAAMGIAGQIDQILMSRSAKSARRCVYCCIVLVFLVDLAGVIVLRAAPQFVPDDLGRTEELKWTPRGLWEALKKFHYDSVDLVLLCLARLVIGIRQVRHGNGAAYEKDDDAGSDECLPPTLACLQLQRRPALQEAQLHAQHLLQQNSQRQRLHGRVILDVIGHHIVH